MLAKILSLIGNGGILPLGFLPFTICIAAYYSSFSAISTARFVSSAFCFPLSTRFARSTDMAAMESAWRGESRLCTFCQSWYGHLSSTQTVCIVPCQVWYGIVLLVHFQLASVGSKEGYSRNFAYHTRGLRISIRQLEQC